MLGEKGLHFLTGKVIDEDFVDLFEVPLVGADNGVAHGLQE